MQSPTGSALEGNPNASVRGDDYWTKIIMHNVEQFQKEKDAVKAKIKENQAKMRDDLLKQMEAHKRAKIDEKKNDLEYFDIIRKQKEDLAREEQEKKDSIRQKVIEQKLIRDKQIMEHAQLKTQARREKMADHEKLRLLEKELHDHQAKIRESKRLTQEKVMSNYDQ